MYLTEDSVKFLIMSDKIKEASDAIEQIYKLDDVTIDEIMMEKRKTSQKQTSTVTVKEAYISRYYRTGSLVAVMVMIIHQTAGMSVILLYSNTIIA